MTYQGFRYTGIDTVHAHVVSVVGGPAQSQLAQIAGTHHQSGKLVCLIHEYQGTDSGLSVLKGHIQIFRILVNIFKVLQHRVLNVDFAEGDPQLLT